MRTRSGCSGPPSSPSGAFWWWSWWPGRPRRPPPIPAHPVLQVIPGHDVTIGREPGPVADILRGLLHDLPHRRVGLLTHQKLARALPGLVGDPYRGRLTMVEYFGSGLSRGSNKWT